MKIVKIISDKTYIGNDGNTYHYNNYAILLDNGREKELEILDLNGNPILDNHFNLFSFNWKEQGNNDNNE